MATAVRPAPRSIAVVEGALPVGLDEYHTVHHRLTVRIHQTPNTSRPRCQGWRRCDTLYFPPHSLLPVPRSIAVVGGVGVRVASTIAHLSFAVPSPALQIGVVKDGTCMCVPVAIATAVRSVPRSIGVAEGR